MSALGVVVLQVLSCLGFGAGVLRALGADDGLKTGEHWALAFAAGFGVLGWLVFPLGMVGFLSPGPLAVLLAVGLPLVVLLKCPEAPFTLPPPDALGWVLLALLGAVLAFDLAEGVAPPADADSLAYHFTLPKRFLEAGFIEFVPRPLEWAVPLLVQMTYVPVFGIGGEMALTLWAMVSGWGAGALVFVLCRNHLGRNGSLAVTLIFLTTPAVVYGGGSGQVETKIALFVLLGAWAAARAIDTGRAGYAVLAGVGAGFYVGAKYTGLLFAAAAGLVVLFQRRWFALGVAFGFVVLAAGFQWYAWNAFNTGDPGFPMLFQWLGQDDLVVWTKAQDLFFKQAFFEIENPRPHTLLWLIRYPFEVTLGLSVLPDSGRVGLGPFGLLALPFAAMGLWRFRERVRRSPLRVYAAIAILFYVVWFFAGGSLRVRHIVPVLPLMLICMTVAAWRFAEEKRLLASLSGALAAAILVQTSGHGVFALNYFKHLAYGDRESFLARNVEGYPAVPWLNANLTQAERVFLVHRQPQYFLKVRYFFGSSLNQAALEMRPGKADSSTLHQQLRGLGITHVLLDRRDTGAASPYQPPFDVLDGAGCLTPVKKFPSTRVRSRTLPGLQSVPRTLVVLRLEDEGCLL